MPRLYREAPINAIWEGSGNVQCLDMLRALSRTPGSLEALLCEIDKAKGQNKCFDLHVQQLKQTVSDLNNFEYRARSVVESMALALQASVLWQSGNDLVADAFCRSCFQTGSHQLYGTLPEEINCEAMIERASLGITLK